MAYKFIKKKNKMNQTCSIQLNPSCIMNVPFQNYEKNFTFIVNGEEFLTSKFISDLLSPKICKIHTIDPTIDLFYINTNEHGQFSYVLDLVKFSLNTIPLSEIPFIYEVMEILQNETISLSEEELQQELTIDNIFSSIQQHEKFVKFYSKSYQQEIEYIASHFYEICDNKKYNLSLLNQNTIERILNHSNLILKDEDQLLHFVNFLYSQDHEFTSLYETIYFERVSSNSISNFIDQFDISNITNSIWRNLSLRLKHDVKVIVNHNDQNRYIRKKMAFVENNEFNGIINYLIQNSGNNIDNEITLTSSSNDHEDKNDNWTDIKNVLYFNKEDKGFFTKNIKDSWICFDFKKRKIIPTGYTVKTDVGQFLKSWFIEVSNDNKTWEIIDERDCSDLNAKYKVKTYKMNKPNFKEVQYIRIRQDKSHTSYHLGINTFEIYGILLT